MAWQDFAARRQRLQSERERRQAELQTAGQLIAKLQTTLPVAQQREADVVGLARDGGAPAWSDVPRPSIDGGGARWG